MNEFINTSTKKQPHHSHIDPIIIYQTGKVGSSTVLTSLIHFLKSEAREVPVYHAHHLNGLEKLEADVKGRFPNPAQVLEKLKIDKELRRKIDSDATQNWNVITLTRDPVARNISTLFQMLQVFIPDWKSKYEENQLDLRELQNLLIKQSGGGPGPGDWFDVQLKPVFGIDVYSSDFPHQQGYDIYRSKNRHRLLLIRLEDLNRIGQEAMNLFLNVKNFNFIPSNVGEEKVYSVLYREFKKLPLPKSYLERMYTSRYARHFYTDKEIENFIHKWMEPERQRPLSS
jgi:Putative capsular polysaccharide synthesis protein